jgi:hypothetical protein
MADDSVIPRNRGLNVGGVLIGLGVLALVAVVVFVVLSARGDQALRTQAVTSAASSLAASNAPLQN